MKAQIAFETSAIYTFGLLFMVVIGAFFLLYVVDLPEKLRTNNCRISGPFECNDFELRDPILGQSTAEVGVVFRNMGDQTLYIVQSSWKAYCPTCNVNFQHCNNSLGFGAALNGASFDIVLAPGDAATFECNPGPQYYIDYPATGEPATADFEFEYYAFREAHYPKRVKGTVTSVVT